MGRPILAAMLSCAGTTLTDEEKKLFAEYNPLGITLFNRNIKNAAQVKKLVEEIKNVINRDDVLIAIDEEGGRVSRLKMIVKLKKIANQQFVSEEVLGREALKYTKMQSELISHQMHKFGINVNYAPVVDKKTKIQNAVLKNRCFSGNTDKIIKYASKMADTFINNGICPCIKHIPGHFAIDSDPHLEQLETDMLLENIYKEVDYLQAFKNYPMLMTAHIKLNAIDDRFPVTMSKKGIKELLRKHLGLENFLISDAIEMRSLKGTILEKAENCWNSGLDAICYCAGQYENLYDICHMKRFLTEKSEIRFANIQKVIHTKPQFTDVSMQQKAYYNKFQDKLNETYAYDATEVLNKMLSKGEIK